MEMKPEPVELPNPGSKRKSPTELTLALLRRHGYFCDIVERRNPRIVNKTHDMFGIIDIIALTAQGTLGVQSTGNDFANHWTKLTKTKAVASARWVSTPGNGLMLIAWRDIKGKRGILHRAPRIKMIVIEDLIPALREQNVKTHRIVAGHLLHPKTLEQEYE